MSVEHLDLGSHLFFGVLLLDENEDYTIYGIEILEVEDSSEIMTPEAVYAFPPKLINPELHNMLRLKNLLGKTIVAKVEETSKGVKSVVIEMLIENQKLSKTLTETLEIAKLKDNQEMEAKVYTYTDWSNSFLLN